MIEYSIPGTGVVLIKDDSLVLCKGFGLANIQRGEELNSLSVFPVASISKTVLSLGIMKLVEQGKLNLQEKLSEIAPEITFSNKWEETDPVRLIHLLEHTSGFESIHFNEFYNINNSELSLEEVLNINSNSRVCRWKPGTKIAYSSSGYTILGYIIEKITGIVFKEFVETEIFTPLRLRNSDYNNNENLVTGYSSESLDAVPGYNLYHYPANGLSMSLQDFAIFMKLLINKGSLDSTVLITESTFDKMLMPESTIRSPTYLKSGYAKGIYTDAGKPIVMHGHRGLQYGYYTTFRISTEHKFGYGIMMNSTCSEKALRKFEAMLFEYLSAGFRVKNENVETSNCEFLDQYCGYYLPTNSTNGNTPFVELLTQSFCLSCQDDTLVQGWLFGNEQKLVYMGSSRFKVAGGSVASVVLSENENGNKVYNEIWESAEQVSSIKYFLFIGWIIGSLIIMCISFLYLLALFIQRFVLRSNIDGFVVKINFGVPFLVLILIGLIALNIKIYDLGVVTLPSVSLFMLSLMIPVTTLLSLYSLIRIYRTKISPFRVSVYSLFALANSGITIYLWYWGLIGFMSWRW